MKVRIKKIHPNAIIPTYSKPGDAGMDLVAVERYYDEYGNVHYNTGISIEIPEGYVGLIFPRSSLSKKALSLANSVGVIDSGYRGEIMFKFKFTGLVYNNFEEAVVENELNEDDHYIDFPDVNKELENYHYNVGDRIGQLIIIPYPKIEFEEVQDLSETERDSGGFGSTGK